MEFNADEDCLNFEDLQNRINDFFDRSSIEENIRTQLLEYEMISSMYSNPGELVLDDPSVISELQAYSSGIGYDIPPQLDYHLNVQIENLLFEICVSLPLQYPTEEPDVFVRNETYDRYEQRELNDQLCAYISSLPKGEICILSTISWLQENALLFKNKKKTLDEVTPKRSCNEQIWGRLWIHSHHIYSKTKMRALLELAEQFNMTGFFLPGSPGIICYEGLMEDCEECWKRVKAMNWKKIKCVRRDSGSVTEVDNKNSYRRFTRFEELLFEGGKIRGRQFHMDLREFYGYLVKHNSEDLFKIFFNVEGRTSS